MNVKKLSLASLFLVLSCSFGFSQTGDVIEGATFVKVTKLEQLVPGNKFLLVCYDHTDKKQGYWAMAGTSQSKKVTVETSTNGSVSMSLIKTDVSTTGTSENYPTVFTVEEIDGGYAFKTNAGYVYFGGNGHLDYSDDPKVWTLEEAGETSWGQTGDTETGLFFWSYNGHYIKYKGEGNSGTPQFWGKSSTPNPMALYVQSQGGTDMGETLITLRRSTAEDAEDLNYYATTYYEQDFLLDDHVTAYGINNVFTEPVAGNVALELSDAVAAPTMPVFTGTPVLLVVENDDPEADVTVQYPIFLLETSTTENTVSTNLVGTLEGEETAPENSYALVLLEDGDVAFGKTAAIPAHRAYIQLAEGSEVKSLTFNFNKSTGIKEVSAPEVNNDAIYNLVGQQVTKNYKGVVVKNGKKFLNK